MRREWLAIGWLGMAVAMAAEAWAVESVKLSLDSPAAQLHYDRRQNLLQATGGVRIEYRNLEARADRLVANLKEQWALLEGNISLRREEQTAEGKRARLNLRTGEFEMEQVSGALGPEVLGGITVAPFYLRGALLMGERDGPLRGRHLQITSCELDPPHYELEVSGLTLIPDRRLTLERTSLQVLRRTLLRLPRLSIPLRTLRTHRPSFLPLIGSSEVEGIFVKYNYPYGDLTSQNFGALHLDWMQKQGFRLGNEYHYLIGSGRGSLVVDYVPDRKALTAQWQHQQRMGPLMDLTSRGNYSQNNYFSLTSTRSLNAEADWSYRSRRFSSQALQRWSRTNSQKSQNFSWNVTQRWEGVNLQSSLRLTRRTTTAGNPDDLELLTDLRLQGQLPAFTWSLEDNRRADPDSYDGDRFYSNTSGLPVLTLQTDDRRLKWGWWKGVQGRYQVSVGRFREVARQQATAKVIKVTRAQVRADLSGQPIALGSGLQWSWSGGIDQSVFSDSTAQYVLNAQSGLDLRPSRQWQSSLRYSFSEPAGFSPLQRFDFASHTNRLTLTARYQSQRSQANLSFGSDLRRGRFQPLTLNWTYRPGATAEMTLYGTYDPNGRGLTLGDLRWRWRQGAHFYWEGGVRYDFEQGRLSDARSTLSVPLTDDLRVQSLLGYSGFTKRIEFSDLLFTYDLHCWQALLFYSKQRDELRFDLSLKALGLGIGDFGVGRFGQQFDTSFGQVF